MKIQDFLLTLKELKGVIQNTSIDDKIDYFHYYTTLIKFGIGRARMTLPKKLEIIKLQERKELLLLKDLIKSFLINILENF